MRLFTQKIWSGTAANTEQFTDAELNALLGSADMFAVHAHTNRASGTTPALKINFYHSADNKNWINLSALSYTSSVLVAGAVNDLSVLTEALSGTSSRLGFVRIGVLTSGTTAEVDVELYVTGRGF